MTRANHIHEIGPDVGRCRARQVPRRAYRRRYSVIACALGFAVAAPTAACGGATRRLSEDTNFALPPESAPSVEPTDPALDTSNRLLRRTTLAELVAMPLEARQQAIFGALYNTLDRPKPHTLTQDALTAALARRGERSHEEGPWHVRWGVDGTADLQANALRFYFDVVPDHAATLADALTADLDARGVRRYSFKTLVALENYDIPVAAVLYVERADAEAGEAAALDFARRHADALWPEEPPFTERLAPGLGRADEPGPHGPPGVAGNSFGGGMAHLVARALEDAAPELDAAAVAARIRTTLRAVGFDPDAPWHVPR